jgi:hypothetical protein
VLDFIEVHAVSIPAASTKFLYFSMAYGLFLPLACRPPRYRLLLATARGNHSSTEE